MPPPAKPGARARTPATPKPPKPTAKARALERQLHEARTEIRLHRAQASLRRLKESSALDYDWVGPWLDVLSQRQVEPGWYPLGGTSARRYGHYFPFFQSEQQLTLLRDLSRIVVGTNNYAQGMLGGLTNFVIGTGFKVKVAAEGAGAKANAQKLRDFLDQWGAENLWGEFQREAFWRHREDGDELIRLFPDDGLLKVRHVWPEQLTQPPGTTVAEWGYGVRMPAGDDAAPHPEAYYVADLDDPHRGEEVSSRDLIHLKANSRTGIKRGLPDFSFGTKDSLDAAGRLTRNLGEGAAIREAIAFMRQHAAGTGPDEVEEFRTADADFRERVPFSDGIYRPVNSWDPGTVVDFPEGMQHAGVPANEGTAAHTSVVQVLLRSAGVRWNAPEWLVSGDASNMGAYTSSLVAESPFVKSVVAAQDYYKARFLLIVRRAVEVAVAHGLLPGDVMEGVTLDLVPPSPEVRNKLEETQRAQIEIPLGVDSPQRYCESQDRDFERIAQENRAAAAEKPAQPGGGVQTPAPAATEPGLPELPRVESLLESDSGEGRHEGEVWQGKSGRWFTLKNGHVAPAKAPSSYEKYKARYGDRSGAGGQPAPDAAKRTGSLPDGTEVHFVPHPSAARKPGDYATVVVSAAALDGAWSRDEGYYIPPGGGGAEIAGRRDRFARFLDSGQPVEAPKAVLSGDAVALDDGRHRFSVLRDMGIDRVAVTVPAEQAEEFARRFGGDKAESLEFDAALHRVLLEHGFTGTLTDRAGHNRQYVDGRQVASATDAAGGEAGAGARTSGAHEPTAEDARAVRDALAKNAPTDIEQKAPGLLAKLGDKALELVARAYIKMGEWTPAVMKVASVLGELLDTPSDMRKLAYNPTMAGGQDHAGLGHNDFVKQNLTEVLGFGVSGHLAATIAAQVLSRAFVYAKSKLAGTKTESEADGLSEVAELIAAVFAEVNKSMGLEGAPSAEQVRAALSQLLKG